MNAQERCPSCNAQLPPPAEFPVWCDQCNWNLDPDKARDDPRPPLADIYDRLGARLSASLFDAVMREGEVRPGRSFSNVLALAIAALVYVVTAALAAAGAWIAVVGWPNPFALLLAVVLLGSAWVTRPRFARPPDAVLERSQWPALYGFVDRIADELGADRAAGITISPDFNASIRRTGFSGRHYVELGLPLITTFSPQERVAVLAHEFSHGVNGDPLRGTFLGNAVSILFHWVYVIRPDEIWESSENAKFGPIAAILMIPVNLALVGVSMLILGFAYGLIALLYRQSQRAEYYADLLATRVSGAGAMIAVLQKLYFGGSVNQVIHRYANYRGNGENLFDNIRDSVRKIPEREVERLRRLSVSQGARVDATHPPTAHRVAFIMRHGEAAGTYMPSVEEVQQIDDELARFHETVARTLIERNDVSLWR